MIVDRYITREIVKPLLAVCGVLVMIFASYSSARYLAEAADGVLRPDTVLNLILLKTLIALEVLLPMALYLSVIVGLGRLYSDYEMTAFSASGVSNGRVLGVVLRLSLIVATIVGCLSLFGRPWAYEMSYWLESRAEAGFDMSMLEDGHFYAGSEPPRIIFVERADRRRNRLQGVFVQSDRGETTRITYAAEAYQPDPDNPQTLILLRGHSYDLDRRGTSDRLGEFDELTLRLDDQAGGDVSGKRKATPTTMLAASDDPKDTAEFQWRLSTPLATVLLALLGVPLSRAAPRQGRYAKALAAVLFYALFYNIFALAKTLLEQGRVGSIPGIWWPSALLAALILALLWWPTGAARLRRRFRRLASATGTDGAVRLRP